jgi:hypothetical protein
VILNGFGQEADLIAPTTGSPSELSGASASIIVMKIDNMPEPTATSISRLWTGQSMWDAELISQNPLRLSVSLNSMVCGHRLLACVCPLTSMIAQKGPRPHRLA